MALIEDALKGNVVMVLALGAGTVVLPKILPHLSPPLRATLKSGLTLFVEADSEAEGGIVGKLSAAAAKEMLQEISKPGSDEQHRAAAEGVMQRYQQTARARSHRRAWDEQDESARYHRHMAALREALDAAGQDSPKEARKLLGDLSGRLAEAA